MKVVVADKNKQNFVDDLSIPMLNLLPKSSTLPSLVVINLAKVEIYVFQIATWLLRAWSRDQRVLWL